MGKYMRFIHRAQYLARQRNEVLTHATAWMNLRTNKLTAEPRYAHKHTPTDANTRGDMCMNPFP